MRSLTNVAFVPLSHARTPWAGSGVEGVDSPSLARAADNVYRRSHLTVTTVLFVLSVK